MQRRRLVAAAVILGTVLALAGVGGAVFGRTLVHAFLSSVARSALARQNPVLGDGLYAGLCGTGSPLPDGNRVGACIGVVAGSHFYVVDAGSGSTRNVRLMNLPLARTDAILLTHFHSDHIADLGEMELQRWAAGSNTASVEVIGPRGVESVVAGFNAAFRLDAGYRVAHHGPETMPPGGAGGIARPFDLPAAPGGSVVVVDGDGVKITAFKVDHGPVEPAVGYRFDYKGRSLVVSGDTRYSDSLIAHARGADVLLCEALNAPMVQLLNGNADLSGSPSFQKITHDIPNYHATPEDAAKMAQASGVRRLVLYHIIPPLPSRLVKSLFLGDAKKHFRGPITMGEDGMLISMPVESDSITIRRVF